MVEAAATALPNNRVNRAADAARARIFLSISEAILWWETHRRRRVGLAIFGMAAVATVALAM